MRLEFHRIHPEGERHFLHVLLQPEEGLGRAVAARNAPGTGLLVYTTSQSKRAAGSQYVLSARKPVTI